MAKQVQILRFEARSTDRDRQTIDAVREALKLSPDLQAVLEKKYPGVKVKIKRAEGLPIHALVHHILVSIDWHAVASGAEKALSQFATIEFLKLAKKRVRNLFASPALLPELPAPATAKKSVVKEEPAKRRASAKNVAATKKVAAKKSSPVLKAPRKKTSGRSQDNGRG